MLYLIALEVHRNLLSHGAGIVVVRTWTYSNLAIYLNLVSHRAADGEINDVIYQCSGGWIYERSIVLFCYISCYSYITVFLFYFLFLWLDL